MKRTRLRHGRQSPGSVSTPLPLIHYFAEHMKAVLFLIGLLLIPLCVATTTTLVSLVESIRPASSALIPPSAWALSGGFALWLIIFFCLTRPVRSYVLAHELTHALWATLSGIEVHGMQIKRERGSVVLAKTNFLVTLAPYFFPLYTILVIGIYYLLGVFYDVQKFSLIWLGLIGLTWGFHFSFTIVTLMQHQTDIHEYGRFFSYSIIYLFNIVGIILWVVIVSEPKLEEMVTILRLEILRVYQEVYAVCANLAGGVKETVKTISGDKLQ